MWQKDMGPVPGDRAAFFDLFLLSRFLLLKTSTSLCFFPQAKHLIDADGNVKA